jgi:hypothetical protein
MLRLGVSGAAFPTIALEPQDVTADQAMIITNERTTVTYRTKQHSNR